MSFECEMGRGWAAEAQRAVWRPLMLAEMTFPCAFKTRVSIMSLGLKEWCDYLSLKPFLMSLSMIESFRNFSLLASSSTSTASIVHARKIASSFFLRVEFFFKVFKIKHVFLSFLSTEQSPSISFCKCDCFVIPLITVFPADKLNSTQPHHRGLIRTCRPQLG